MMNDRPEPRQAEPDRGLCGTCVYARVITSDRGSEFVFCGQSTTVLRLPRYPRLPVRQCIGYSRG